MKKIIPIILIGIFLLSVIVSASYDAFIEERIETYDYIIVTKDDLVDSIVNSNFIDWKTQIGYKIKIITLSDPEIKEQQGHDLAAQIRNFLIDYYKIWGINYVLFIGNIQDIPMRYCFPDSTNHENYAKLPLLNLILTGGEVPTDYYYADLSNSDKDSWDADADGYYGEAEDDIPDFKAEVFVGRIPISNPDSIKYTLDKIVKFEKDTGNWKNNVLNAGAISWFHNETSGGWRYPFYDGCILLSKIENDILQDGFEITHFSEQSGVATSLFDWNPLNRKTFMQTWSSGQFGIINIKAHGYPFCVCRKIQIRDDGDEITESSETITRSFLDIYSNLDDDFPSIVFFTSCSVGYPEKNVLGRLGVDLLTNPGFGSAVSVVCFTRKGNANPYWPEYHGGVEDINYHFMKFLVNSSSPSFNVGKALYESKFTYFNNYSFFEHWGSDFPENKYFYLTQDYKTLFGLNLYGDPSLIWAGINL